MIPAQMTQEQLAKVIARFPLAVGIEADWAWLVGFANRTSCRRSDGKPWTKASLAGLLSRHGLSIDWAAVRLVRRSK